MNWIRYIPIEKDFKAIEVARLAYPQCEKIDTEGRVSNKAVPVVSRMLRGIKGVIEVKHGVFWAEENMIKSQL